MAPSPPHAAADRYDIVVLGGGAAGLTAAGISASFGARTALVERHLPGGDCTWTGCVPSKALLHLAKQVHGARHLAAAGGLAAPPAPDFGRIMAMVRDTRRRVYEAADSPAVLAEHGIEVLIGNGSFLGPRDLAVQTEDGLRRIAFRRGIIATGAAPILPPVNGLSAASCLTNATIFDLETQPRRLAVLGAGPVGLELGQAFARLGSQVTILDVADRILPGDDPLCDAILRPALEAEGLSFRLGQSVAAVEETEAGLRLTVGAPNSGTTAIAPTSLTADALLVAVGKRPRIDGVGLDVAGVAATSAGIAVDRHARTNRHHIFAAGDVTGGAMLSHVAEDMAKAAAINAVFALPIRRFEVRVVPRVTFTDPECAQVGQTAAQLAAAGTTFDTIHLPYDKIDRAVMEGAPAGAIVIHARRGRILGAVAVGTGAGEIIGELALAMRNGVKLTSISDTIHAYPTLLAGARRAADQAWVRRHRRGYSRLVRALYRYRGQIPAYVGTRQIM